VFLDGLAGFADVKEFIELSIFSRIEEVGAVSYPVSTHSLWTAL